MKKYLITLSVLLAASAHASENGQSDAYQAEYLSGIEYFEQGQFHAASDSFREAIRREPSPRMGPDEYIPYIYLSATQFEIGNALEARDALIQSQVHGTAPQTDVGKQLLNRYAADIMSAPLRSVELASTPSEVSTDEMATPVLVSNSEAASVPARILKRCANAADMEELPWYFHYKCGVDLMKAGDAQRAIVSFKMGANDRKDSARGKRMYGMWYIDYLPYYQIALAQSRLGDWESARAAIQTSAEFHEFSPIDPDYNSYIELDRLIKENLEKGES